MGRRAALACLALACAAGCQAPRTTDTVVVITLDTTRADRIGCYGYEKARTPHLDGLALEGTRFEDAMSVAPTTLPSHCSMFTGRYPAEHGVRYNGMFVLPESAHTLPERLGEAGWSTAGVPAAFPVATSSGIGQGFQQYFDLFAEEGADDLPMHAERDAKDVTDHGLRVLEGATGKKLFLWLHYYDPHFEYEPPFPFSAEYRERPYDGEIAYMDREIGRFVEGLRKAGRYDDALILVLGDHGEGLYDHGEKMHSYLVYQSTMHVPFLARAPGGKSKNVVSEPVSVIDVYRTVLDYAGVPESGESRSISLRKAIEGKAPDRRNLHFETLAGSLVFGWSPLEGMRRGNWKVIRSTEPELFDLASDPDEKVNRFSSDGSVAADLEAVLQQDLDAFAASAAPSESTAAPVDREALERLASLGYIGGTLSSERRGGPAPRALIHFEVEMFTGRRLMGTEDFEGARALYDRLLSEDPTNRHALSQASVAAAKAGDLEGSAAYAARLTETYPEFVDGWVYLGEARVAQGRFPDAEAVFRAAAERHPTEIALSYRLGLSLLAQDKVGEAEAAFRKAIEGAGETVPPAFAVALGLAAAKKGDAARAATFLREAIAGGYDDREVLLTEPMLAPLRAVPGFREIVDRIPARTEPKSVPAASE